MSRLEKVVEALKEAFKEIGASWYLSNIGEEKVGQAAIDALDEGWTDVPEGMVLVPREPDGNMIYAGMQHAGSGRYDVIAKRIYKAMLSAITPPKPEGE